MPVKARGCTSHVPTEVPNWKPNSLSCHECHLYQIVEQEQFEPVSLSCHRFEILWILSEQKLHVGNFGSFHIF